MEAVEAAFVADAVDEAKFTSLDSELFEEVGFACLDFSVITEEFATFFN